MGIIRAIREARVVTSPKLMSTLAQLQNEFAKIRTEDDRIVVKLTKKLKAKYTYHTNSIEGNTLTESETRSFIETGMTVSGKSMKDYMEAKNIPSALNMLMGMTREKKPLLKISDLLELHALVVEGIEEASPGYFRRGFVRLANSAYVPPPAYELDLLVNEMIEYVNKNRHKLNPFELSFQDAPLVCLHSPVRRRQRQSRAVAGGIDPDEARITSDHRQDRTQEKISQRT